VWHKLASYWHWRIKLSRICRLRIVVWPKKLAPCILAHEVGPGCHDRNIVVPCWSSGAAIATWRDQLELVYLHICPGKMADNCWRLTSGSFHFGASGFSRQLPTSDQWVSSFWDQWVFQTTDDVVPVDLFILGPVGFPDNWWRRTSGSFHFATSGFSKQLMTSYQWVSSFWDQWVFQTTDDVGPVGLYILGPVGFPNNWWRRTSGSLHFGTSGFSKQLMTSYQWVSSFWDQWVFQTTADVGPVGLSIFGQVGLLSCFRSSGTSE
jgi:hypothetical protein